MGTPFMGELRLMSFNFPPRGWALANGQLLPINQNQALFSLLGTMYGGNGQTNFALPNLQGRVAMHTGTGFTQGEIAGETAHTITQNELPAHTHALQASTATATGSPVPVNNVLSQGLNVYGDATQLVTLLPATVTNTGGSQPHNNLMPYTVVSVCIALQGIFPSRN